MYQSPLAQRCTALLTREELDLQVYRRHAFSTGFVLQCKSEGRNFWLGTAHLPHQQRPDAEDVWLSDLAKIDEVLAMSRHHDVVLLGIDANQNLMNSNPCFAALSRLQLLVRHRSLEFNAPCGNTWVARGESSMIDWFLMRWPVIECTYHLREVLRTALPSDQTLCQGASQDRPTQPAPRPKHGCGRWRVDSSRIEAAACEPSFRFSQESFAALCQSARGTRHACRHIDTETLHMSRN